MNRNENVEDVLRQSLPSASSEEAGSARDRVYSRLRSGSAGVLREDLINFNPPRTSARRWFAAAVAAALAIGAVWAGSAWQSQRGHPTFENAEGSRMVLPQEIVRSM